MTASNPDEREFETYRDIPIRVNENGEFVIRRLPFNKCGQFDESPMRFENVRQARKAIDDDITKARAEVAGKTIEVWTLRGDEPRKATASGIHGGTGRLVASYEDGTQADINGSGYGSQNVFSTLEEAEAVAALEKAAREATKTATRERERLGISLPKEGRVGPEGVVAAFLALRAKVEEHRAAAASRAAQAGGAPAPVASDDDEA